MLGSTTVLRGVTRRNAPSEKRPQPTLVYQGQDNTHLGGMWRTNSPLPGSEI